MEIKRLDENGKVRNEFYQFALQCCIEGREIWVDIDGYEEMYQVSNIGRIKSFRNKQEKILVPTYNPKGYKTITLCNSKKTMFVIHRLEGIAFIPNPENKATINHEDGIKTNLLLTNIFWNTYSENNFHAFRTGLRVAPYSTLGKKGKDSKRSKPIIQLDKDNNPIKRFWSATVAGLELGICRSSICFCLNKRTKTAGGYKWSYELQT